MNEETQDKPLTPREFLNTLPNSPTDEQVNIYKQSSPGGRVRLFTSSDGKRAYILRGISGHELQKIQEGFVNTVAPERYVVALKTKLAEQCTIWTNSTTTGKLTEMDIKGSGAGLLDTLHEVISDLSDYMEAPVIRSLSADL